MPSVVGLLEQRECAARRRVEWVIACLRFGEALAPGVAGQGGGW